MMIASTTCNTRFATQFAKSSAKILQNSSVTPIFKIDDGPRTVRTDFYGGGGDWDAEDQQRLIAAIPGAIARVDDLIHRLEEKKSDLGEPTLAPRAAFQRRKLNPAIVASAAALYLDGHYPQAVFEAGKALVALVKAKSGKYDVDGAPLMQAVFSVNNPVLAFNSLADQSDRDEQQGMMQIYVGAVMAIRNPGGHRVGMVEQPERALQHLDLLSYLDDRLDDVKNIR